MHIHCHPEFGLLDLLRSGSANCVALATDIVECVESVECKATFYFVPPRRRSPLKLKLKREESRIRIPPSSLTCGANATLLDRSSGVRIVLPSLTHSISPSSSSSSFSHSVSRLGSGGRGRDRSMELDCFSAVGRQLTDLSPTSRYRLQSPSIVHGAGQGRAGPWGRVGVGRLHLSFVILVRPSEATGEAPSPDRLTVARAGPSIT